MKKNISFDVKSDKVCNVENCNNRIKARLVDMANHGGKAAQNILKCHRCFEALAASEMRRSDIPAYKTNLKHIKALRFQFKLDKPDPKADAKTKTAKS